MPLRRKQLNKLLRRSLLSVLLIAAVLGNAAAAFAAGATAYIVKYKDAPDGAPFGVVSEAEALRLDRAGLLQWYEPDGEMTLLDGDVSPFYTEDKWDLALINAEPAFLMGALGEGVKVGVLDSGVNPVPALEGRLLPGRNYVEETATDDTADNYGHGTLVAALIAGQTEDGFLGAAPEAQIVPLKVTDGKMISVSAVCRAIYGAVDDYGCGVLNLSLGIYNDSMALREAIDHAAEKGVVVVAAVGNSGTRGKVYPAEYENTVGVGAVDQSGSVYYHSNHNGSVWLTAPGANVKTAGRLGGYTTASGTSFSVPLVTAAAAVLLGLDPRLTADEVASILKDTAQDAGSTGWDEYYGWGILDLGAAAARLGGAQIAVPCAFVSDAALVNTADEDVECTYYLAEYDENGVCLGVTATQLMLPARGRVQIDPPQSAYYGQFVCLTATGTPLAVARKSHGNN